MCDVNAPQIYAVTLTDVEYLKLILTHKPELLGADIEHISNIIRNNYIGDDEIEYQASQYDSISFQVGNTIFYAGDYYSIGEVRLSTPIIIYYYVYDGIDDTVIHDMQQAVKGITTTKPIYI